jgi:hypothetical protein
VPVSLLFVTLTVVITWPQARFLTTRVADHFDAFFSIWRVRWIAHQLVAAPWDLFHGNIFYPQRYTLAFSDPVLLEGLTAAPLLWLGLSPILVYNLLILGSFVLCGTAAATLGFRLTQSHAGGILAGIIFAFAPYRFEHFFHLEILWAFWMPIAMLALHRVTETGAVRDGLRTGLAVVGQLLSSLYYALYLGAVLIVAAPFLLRWRRPEGLRAVRALATGAAVAALLALVYVQPLLKIREEVAERELAETATYSATLTSYLSSPASNWLYGWTSEIGGPELRLFPGIVAIGLAAIAFWRPRRTTWAYIAVLAFAFVASLGANAPLFGALRVYLDPYGMVRVPARFGALVLLALGALAGIGAARLLGAIKAPRVRLGVATILTSVMVVEYASSPALMPVTADVPPAYRWLRDQPRGVLVELPLPEVHALPGNDPERQYYSTMHWMPLMNGYSGFYPRSYLALMYHLRVFPRGQWVDLLLARGAEYIFIHERGMAPDLLQLTLDRAEVHPEIVRVGRFPHRDDAVWVYVKR